MGKKIKKAFKKVVKVAISPITAPTKAVAKAVTKAIQGPKPKDMSGALEAQTAAQQAQYDQGIQAQRDAAADLSLDNVADIRVGDDAESAFDRTRRKRKPGGSLASQLGIGV